MKEEQEKAPLTVYQDIFDNRGDSYNEAGEICPNARIQERQLLIDRLGLNPDHIVCDAPAGGGYLADGLSPLLNAPSQIACIEPSWKFLSAGDPSFQWIQCNLETLALPNASVDRLGSLAGLHHLDNREPFFQEAFRALKPNGRIVVADVKKGTDVAEFLNGPVDEYSETGHDGLFFYDGELSKLLKDAGFIEIEEKFIEYEWQFPSNEIMVCYCKKLFGLHKIPEAKVANILKHYLNIKNSDEKTSIGWSLIYASARKG